MLVSAIGIGILGSFLLGLYCGMDRGGELR
jgi:hypothetical protein